MEVTGKVVVHVDRKEQKQITLGYIRAILWQLGHWDLATAYTGINDCETDESGRTYAYTSHFKDVTDRKLISENPEVANLINMYHYIQKKEVK